MLSRSNTTLYSLSSSVTFTFLANTIKSGSRDDIHRTHTIPTHPSPYLTIPQGPRPRTPSTHVYVYLNSSRCSFCRAIARLNIAPSLRPKSPLPPITNAPFPITKPNPRRWQCAEYCGDSRRICPSHPTPCLPFAKAREYASPFSSSLPRGLINSCPLCRGSFTTPSTHQL
jgi:hypothetical protein